MTFSTELLDRELNSVRVFNERAVDRFTGAQLHDAVDALGRAHRALNALMVTVGGEVGRRSAPELGAGGLSRREGFSTPQEMLAKTFGTSTYEAKRMIDVGNAMSAPSAEAGLDVEGGVPRVEDGAPGPENGVPGVGGSAPGVERGAGVEDGVPGVGGGVPGVERGSGALGPDGMDGGDSGSGEALVDSVRPAPPPKFPYLARAVEAGTLGVEAAALVSRTLNAVESAMEAAAPDAAADAAPDAAPDAGKEADADVADGAPDGGAGGADGGAHSADGGTRGGDAEWMASVRAELREFERKLVGKAQTISLRDLRRVCDRERAWRAPRDVVERERRHREARTLFFGEDADGMTVMTAKMDAASAAPVKAWVEAQVRHAFQQRRTTPGADGNDVVDEGASAAGATADKRFGHLTGVARLRAKAEALADERSAGQIRIDALVSLALHGLDCDRPTSGVKTTVVLRMDAEDLKESVAGATGQLGECDQLRGPISVELLRAMAVDAQVIPVTLGGESLPLDIGRQDRYFTHAQRIALGERDGGCSWCHAPPSFCQAHHIDWWVRNRGRTDISNGVMLCVACHHRIHRDEWKIVVRDDEVWFYPSDIDGRARPPRVGGKAHLALAD